MYYHYQIDSSYQLKIKLDYPYIQGIYFWSRSHLFLNFSVEVLLTNGQRQNAFSKHVKRLWPQSVLHCFRYGIKSSWKSILSYFSSIPSTKPIIKIDQSNYRFRGKNQKMLTIFLSLETFSSTWWSCWSASGTQCCQLM